MKKTKNVFISLTLVVCLVFNLSISVHATVGSDKHTNKSACILDINRISQNCNILKDSIKNKIKTCDSLKGRIKNIAHFIVCAVTVYSVIDFVKSHKDSSHKDIDDPPISEPRKPEYVFGLNEMTQPFWYSDTMYNECIVFHKDPKTGEIFTRTLFKPEQIIAVKDNSLTIDLIEGVHYKRDNKDPYKLIWLEGNSEFVIPYFVPEDLTGGHNDSCGTDGKIENCTYCIGPFIYEKQLAITYTFDSDECAAPHAEYSADLLPKTINRLKNGESLNLFIYGDSIFTGCDSSKMRNRIPYTPTFFELLESQLEVFYPECEITTHNPSVGGWGASDGIANVHNDVTVNHPDLVILGFGMNDIYNNGDVEAGLIHQMISDIQSENPECEFIIVSTFHANPQIGWDINQGTHANGFKALEQTGIACMDMYALHSYLLNHKTFQSTTGNNINHPNDWFARMYASQLLSMLYNYSSK